MNTERTSQSTDDRDKTLVGVPQHPLGATAGAVAAGVATGAVVGVAAGPVGAAVGAAVGAVVGALGGDAIANSVQQAYDADHWREQYSQRPYFKEGDTFEDFGPAYEYGVERGIVHAGREFDEVEPELADRWGGARGNSRLEWERARDAARDAWYESRLRSL